jgi:hypothetical protein
VDCLLVLLIVGVCGLVGGAHVLVFVGNIGLVAVLLFLLCRCFAVNFMLQNMLGNAPSFPYNRLDNSCATRVLHRFESTTAGAYFELVRCCSPLARSVLLVVRSR